MQQAGPERTYHAFLEQGHFMIQRSRSSGRHVFYPRVAEPMTGATDLEWVEASGRATVHAVTIIPRRPPEPPYNVVLVDLAEGPRMMARVDGVAPDAIRIGMSVEARIVTEQDRPVVVFVPAEEAA